MKRVLKWIFLLIFIVIVLASGFLLIPGVQKNITHYFLNRLSVATSSIIKVGEIQGILSPRVVLKNVEFRSAQIKFKAEKAVVSYRPFMLLWGYIHIDNLEVSNFTCAITGEKSVSPPAPSAQVPKTPFFKIIEIRGIKLKEGKVQYADEAASYVVKDIKIAGKIEHDFQELVSKVTLDMGAFEVENFLKVTDSSGEVALSPKDVRFSNLKVRLEHSVFSGEGYVKNFRFPELYGKVTMKSLELKDLKFISPSHHITRPLRGEVMVSGKVSRLEYALKLFHGHAALTARGRADFKGTKRNIFTAKGELRHLDLMDLAMEKFGKTDLNLAFDVTAKIGQDDFPQGNISLTILDSRLGRYQFFPSQIKGMFSKSEFLLEKSSVETDFGAFTLAAKATTEQLEEKLYRLVFDIDFKKCNVHPFVEKIYLGSELNGTLRGEFSGLSWDNVQKTNADVQVKLSSSTLAFINIQEAELRAIWKDQKIINSSLSLKSELADVQVMASFDPKGEIQGKIDSQGKNLSLLAHIFPEVPLKGAYLLHAEVSGQSAAPVASYKLEGENIQYKDFFYTSAKIQGTFAEKTVDYEVELKKYTQQKIELIGHTTFDSGQSKTNVELLRVQYGDQVWTNPREFTFLLSSSSLTIQNLVLGNRGQLLRAHGVIDQKGFSNFSFLLENIRLDSFNHFFSHEKKVGGVLNSSFFVSGAPQSPRVEARLEIADLEISPVCFKKYNAAITYVDGRWEIKGNAHCLDKETLALEGVLYFPLNLSAPFKNIWESKSELVFTIRELPLDFVQNLWPVVETSRGLLNASVTVSGVLSTPVISILAETREGEFKIRDIREPFTAFQLRAHSENKQMELEYLTAKTKQGTLTLKGKGELEKFVPEEFVLDFSLENAPFYYPELFSAIVNGDGSFTKKEDNYYVKAAIEALEGTIEVKVSDQPTRKTDIVFVDSAEPGKETEEEREESLFTDHFDLDIRIRTEGNLWFKMDSSKAELLGDLRLKKDIGRPIVYVGSIRTKQGYYDFLRNRFIITKGVLQFPGTPGFNPNLNIDGEYTELSEIKIMATVRGDLQNPIINLFSDPPQRDVEILSYLLFGKSSQNLTTQEASSVESQVLSFLGRTTVLKVRDILGDKLTIDTLDIRRDEKTQGWRISVGKYLGRKLFVSYTFGFSPEAEDKLRLEWKWGRRWSVESEISQKRSAGADLFWTIEY